MCNSYSFSPFTSISALLKGFVVYLFRGNVTLVVFTCSHKQLPNIHMLASKPSGSLEIRIPHVINQGLGLAATLSGPEQAESSFLLTRLVMDQVIWSHEGKMYRPIL